MIDRIAGLTSSQIAEELGKDGWRLSAVMPNANSFRATFSQKHLCSRHGFGKTLDEAVTSAAEAVLSRPMTPFEYRRQRRRYREFDD